MQDKIELYTDVDTSLLNVKDKDGTCFFCGRATETLFRREWKKEGSFYVLLKKTSIFWFCESCHLLFDKSGRVFNGLIRTTEGKRRFFVTCRNHKGNSILLGKECIKCHLSSSCWLPPLMLHTDDEDFIRDLKFFFKQRFYVLGTKRAFSQQELEV